MEDLLELRIGEDVGKRIEVIESQRIKDIVGLCSGKLNEADPFVICMQTIQFGIDRDACLLFEIPDQGCKRFRGFHQYGRSQDVESHRCDYIPVAFP